MRDLIDRAAAIEALAYENIIDHMDTVYDSELHRCKRAIERILSQLPSAQPERKTGRWIHRERGLFVGAECSKCGDLVTVTSKFCPSCGADMRGDKHEAD